MENMLNFIANCGYTLTDVNPDGKLHRFNVDGKQGGNRNGWYICHENYHEGKTYYNCVIGDWKTGNKHKYRSKRKWSAQQDTEWKKKVEQASKEAEKIKLKFQEETASMAQFEFEEANEVTRVDYLKNKQIDGLYGCKSIIEWDGYCLAVPARDIDGKIWGIQKIHPDGTKLFKYGQKITGCFHQIGEVDEDSTIFICEGFSTGASIRMATNEVVICSFNAKNLIPVAKAIREKYPTKQIVIAGDEDQWTTRPDNTKYNPGRVCAKEAASLINAKAVFPKFKNLETKPTDFNDLFCLEGKEAVQKQLTISIPQLSEELLPEPIKYYVIDGHKSIHVQIDFIASSLIASFSAILGSRIWAKPIREGDHYVPSFIWFMGVGEKGTRKSSAFKYGTKFITDIQRGLDARYDQTKGQNEAELIWLESQIKEKEKEIKKAKDKEEVNELIKELKALKKEIAEKTPIRKTMLFQETTTAGLIELLKGSKDVIGCYDELGHFFNQLHQEHSKDIRGLSLSGYNGNEYYSKKLKGEKDPTILDHFGIIMLGMIQPPTLHKIFSDKKITIDDGLLERFQLCSYPERLPPKRFEHYKRDPHNFKIVADLFFKAMTMAPGNLGAKLHESGEYHYIDFSEEASEKWKDYDLILQEKDRAEPCTFLSGWFAKAPRTLASLANCFYMMDKIIYPSPEKEVQLRHIELAYKWILHTEKHARAIYAGL